jgi:succinate-semialdehyde dehydrogenase/glutarate-semialdehyde dehydrogenase
VILNNPQLFRQQAYIDGEWTAGDSAAIISVVNPSSNVSIGQVPRLA